MKLKMPYIKAYRDRHGKQRYYYRRPGAPSVPLPGEPLSREFREAYEAAVAGAPREIGVERNKPGSFSALIALYYQSGDYRGLKEISRKTRRNDLERFRRKYGEMSVRALERRHATAMLDEIVAAGKSPKSLRRILGVLLTLAQERGWRTDNPMTGMRRPRKASAGFQPWSAAEVAQYEARWPTGSRERLALYLLLGTAQRRSDVVTMGRQHLEGGKIRVVQSKTGTALLLPVHPKLKAEIALLPPGQLTFLLTQYGTPFDPPSFTNWFRGAAREAGLVNRTPHGLRKAALGFLAEAGATGRELMAISGHKNLAEVTLYTDAADQVELAERAMEKLERRTNPSNQGDQVRQEGR